MIQNPKLDHSAGICIIEVIPRLNIVPDGRLFMVIR